MEMYMSACFGHFQPKKWTIRLFFSRILVVVCGGLWWFACIVSGFTAYAPNAGGDLWWFAVMCGGFGFFRWFVVVCGGLRWFAVICGGLSFSHTHQEYTPQRWVGNCRLVASGRQSQSRECSKQLVNSWLLVVYSWKHYEFKTCEENKSLAINNMIIDMTDTYLTIVGYILTKLSK